MRAVDRSSLAIVVAVLLAMLTVAPLTSDGTFIGVGGFLVLILGGVTVALRRARLSSTSVLLTQLLVVLLFTMLLSLTMPGVGEPWFEHYPSLWSAGVEHMRTQASPMDPSDGVTLIFVTSIGLVLVITDLLVEGVRRPGWAIAPLATVFLVPALGLGGDSGLGSFLCIAVGYLAILVAEGLNSTARWTRGLSRDSAEGFGAATPVVWRAAGYLAVPAVIATVLLGIALPTLVLPGVGLGTGPGGNGPLQLTDPTLDLRRNLNQPDDKEVITYRTSGAGGLYLRLASLPQLSGAGWSSVEIRLDEGQTLPEIPGMTNEPAEQRTTEITVEDFGSQYLPLPYAPRSFEASGDWSYDPKSLIVVNKDERASELRNLSYRVDSVDIAPDPSALAKVPAGTPSDDAITGKVPDDLPQDLIDLSKKVTEDADTPAGKAAAIQAYLRGGNFTYSTDRLPGSGYRALENFLLQDKRGYCEQFAGAMAMMARVVGIPSRVSVGFLPGERNGDTWTVSIRDMHAWPELYFAGFGWVRFEPTPASVTGSAPGWTLPPQSSESDNESPSASASASQSQSSSANAPTETQADPTTTGADTNRFPWAKTLLGGAGALALLLILAAPATIRVRRRNARLSGPALADAQVEAAWAEIRDTVLDFGGSWPEGSPHTIGREIGERLDRPESESMGRVATLVERSRYSASFTADATTTELPQITTDIRRGLAAPAGPVRKVVAFLLPKSVLRRSPKEPPAS